MIQEDTSTADFERYKQRISNFTGEFELGLFIFSLKKSLLWIVGFFIIAIVSAFLYLRYTPLVFESSTIIQISTNNNANKILNVQGIQDV